MTYNPSSSTSRGPSSVNLSDRASDLADKASDQIDRAVESASDAARGLANTGRDAQERVSQVAGNLRNAVDKSVAEQPMTTLAVAAAMGFVIGALWKS